MALDTVRREMGHEGDRLVREVYVHLGDVRHRSEVIEYRVEQHGSARLKDGSTVAEASAAFTG